MRNQTLSFPRTRLAAAILCGMLSLPGAADEGARVGQLTLRSSFAEPLRAELPVSGPIRRARIAPRDVHSALGLERDMISTLPAVSFDAATNLITLTTTTPLRELAMALVLEVVGDSGEVTHHVVEIILDVAPIVAPASSVQTPTLASKAVQTRGKARLSRAKPAPTVSSVRAPGRPPATYGPTVSGDTLSHIARRLRPPGMTFRETVKVLYRANPHAFFGGSENNLRLGVSLTMPPTAIRGDVPGVARTTADSARRQSSSSPAEQSARPDSATNVAAGAVTALTVTGSPVTGSTVPGSPVTGSTVTGSPVTGSTVTGSTVTGSTVTGSTVTGPTVTPNPNTVAEAPNTRAALAQVRREIALRARENENFLRQNETLAARMQRLHERIAALRLKLSEQSAAVGEVADGAGRVAGQVGVPRPAVAVETSRTAAERPGQSPGLAKAPSATGAKSGGALTASPMGSPTGVAAKLADTSALTSKASALASRPARTASDAAGARPVQTDQDTAAPADGAQPRTDGVVIAQAPVSERPSERPSERLIPVTAPGTVLANSDTPGQRDAADNVSAEAGSESTAANDVSNAGGVAAATVPLWAEAPPQQSPSLAPTSLAGKALAFASQPAVTRGAAIGGALLLVVGASVTVLRRRRRVKLTKVDSKHREREEGLRSKVSAKAAKALGEDGAFHAERSGAYEEPTWLEHDLSDPELAVAPTSDEMRALFREVDVYVAYGRLEEATTRLRQSIESQPNAHVLRARLGEVLAEANDKDGFLDVARGLYLRLQEDGDEALWGRVSLLGRRLLPDEPLFQQALATPAGRSAENINVVDELATRRRHG